MRSGSWVRAAFTMSALVCGLAAGASPAGAEPYEHKGTFLMGGGFNNPVGTAHQYLNSSGTIMFGGGRNIFDHFALEVEYTHNWLAVDPDVLDRAATDSTEIAGTNASLWSVTLNGVLRFGDLDDNIPWITFGAGYYKRNIQLTQATYTYVPPVWDPWWGWVGGGWVPGETIVGSRADVGLGFNVGIGFDFPIESNGVLFVEARYHRAFLPGVEPQIVPVMAGLRW